jgi:hypothetical protein
MLPNISEIKRIMLAFESHMLDELNFALNALLVYSCNASTPYQLEQYPSLLENIVQYLEDVLKNIPSLRRSPPPQANMLDNFNHDIAKIMKDNPKGDPLAVVKNDMIQGVYSRYEPISELQLLEHARTIIQIFRNLSYTRQNANSLLRNEKCFKLIVELFLDGFDSEISQNCLDLLANLARDIILKNLTEVNQTSILAKVVKLMRSDVTEIIESSLDFFRNLIITTENEPFVEGLLPQYLETLVKLLIHPASNIREGVLELLCYLSDLKMSTKVLIAREPKCLARLVAMLATGAGKQSEKCNRLAAFILSNISTAPAAKTYFLPYEKDLFVIASCDESVSKLICNILSDLDTVGLDNHGF